MPYLIVATPRAGRWNHRTLVPPGLKDKEIEIAVRCIAKARDQQIGKDWLAASHMVKQLQGGREGQELLILADVDTEKLSPKIQKEILHRLERDFDALEHLIVHDIDWDREGRDDPVARPELIQWYRRGYATFTPEPFENTPKLVKSQQSYKNNFIRIYSNIKQRPYLMVTTLALSASAIFVSLIYNFYPTGTIHLLDKTYMPDECQLILGPDSTTCTKKEIEPYVKLWHDLSSPDQQHIYKDSDYEFLYASLREIFNDKDKKKYFNDLKLAVDNDSRLIHGNEISTAFDYIPRKDDTDELKKNIFGDEYPSYVTWDEYVKIRDYYNDIDVAWKFLKTYNDSFIKHFQFKSKNECMKPLVEADSDQHNTSAYEKLKKYNQYLKDLKKYLVHIRSVRYEETCGIPGGDEIDNVTDSNCYKGNQPLKDAELKDYPIAKLIADGCYDYKANSNEWINAKKIANSKNEIVNLYETLEKIYELKSPLCAFDKDKSSCQSTNHKIPVN